MTRRRSSRRVSPEKDKPAGGKPPARSVFVLLCDGEGRAYCVRNAAGLLGLPGGKVEKDEGWWGAACREFAEETGIPFEGGKNKAPLGRQRFFEFGRGDGLHRIRIYFPEEGRRWRASPLAERYPPRTDLASDPDKTEVETLWVPLEEICGEKARPHVEAAVGAFRALRGLRV